jgi:hypothetical protein
MPVYVVVFTLGLVIAVIEGGADTATAEYII